MKKLIITANRGNLRILRHLEAVDDPLSQEHLVDVPGESGKEHVCSIRDTVTDQAGRFARGAALGMETGMSYGEEHHLKREIEHAAIEHMAQRIEYALAAEGFPPWILAAPSEIANEILAALSPTANSKLLGQQNADLTRVSLSDLEARFLSNP